MLYQYPWYLRQRRRPYMWLREWRAFSRVSSDSIAALSRAVRLVSRADEHTPLLCRLMLAQVNGGAFSALASRRAARVLGYASTQPSATHLSAFHASLTPTYKLSWGTVAHRRSAVSGHARGLRLGLDRSRCVSITLSGFTPSPSLRRW